MLINDKKGSTEKSAFGLAQQAKPFLGTPPAIPTTTDDDRNANQKRFRAYEETVPQKEKAIGGRSESRIIICHEWVRIDMTFLLDDILNSDGLAE